MHQDRNRMHQESQLMSPTGYSENSNLEQSKLCEPEHHPAEKSTDDVQNEIGLKIKHKSSGCLDICLKY